MKAEISTVICDFDGVIVNSGGDICNAVNHTLVAHGREALSKEEIFRAVGMGPRALLKRCFGEIDDDELDDVVLPEYLSYYWEHSVEETVLYDGVGETLKKLHDMDIHCAIVTNKPENITHKIVEKLGIAPYIDCIVGPESVTQMKPHPEGILKVIEQLEADAQETIMVGDTYTDIIAGREAEAWTCAVTYGIGDTRRLLESEPDMTIDNFAELLDQDGMLVFEIK